MHCVCIVRPHRITAYIDVVFCYRRSSIYLSVGLSVCLSVVIVNPAKMVELINMLSVMWNRVCPRNHVQDGVQIPKYEGVILRGKGRPIVTIVKYRYLLLWAEQKQLNRWRCRCGLPVGSRKHVGALWPHLANIGWQASFIVNDFESKNLYV